MAARWSSELYSRDSLERERLMAQRTAYVPQGVIPAVLLPFDNDLAIDEPSFRKHLRDVASVEGLSAITVNAHSTEVASCTFDEQKRGPPGAPHAKWRQTAAAHG